MPHPGRRAFLTGSAALGAGLVLVPVRRVLAQGSDQQRLVDRARIVVEEFQADNRFASMRVYAQNAYAALIFPDLLKGGFFVGVEYGRGVMLARDIRSGAWSQPAFFDLISGSLGLQFGGQASDVIFTVMNDGAVKRILSAKFQLGTDASVAAGPVGVGVGAGTTVQFGEDIYVFARGKGLYGGLGVEGSYFRPKEDWNAAYYGRSVTPAQALYEQAVSNPGSAALREALARF